MALIHRCDRCGSDHKDPNDLTHVEIGADETYTSSRQQLNRSDIKLPYKADLCNGCVILALVALKVPAA